MSGGHRAPAGRRQSHKMRHKSDLLFRFGKFFDAPREYRHSVNRLTDLPWRNSDDEKDWSGGFRHHPGETLALAGKAPRARRFGEMDRAQPGTEDRFRPMTERFGWLALALILIGATTNATAASFRGLGGFNEVPGNALNTVLRGMTPDGSELVGRAEDPLGDRAYVYGEETLSMNLVGLDLPGGSEFSEAIGRVPSASGANLFTVGHSDGPISRRVWFENVVVSTGATTASLIPSHPNLGADMQAIGVGRNGRIVFESLGDFYYYDVPTTSFQQLALDKVNDIDFPGTRIVGRATNPTNGFPEAHLWDELRGLRALGSLPGGDASTAQGISSSGRIVVGESTSGRTGDGEAFRWHPDLGMHALDPIVDGGFASRAFASSDGNEVVGIYGPAGAERAFLWTPRLGRVDLQNHLATDYGLAPQLLGWDLTVATQISANGRIIAGVGTNPNGDNEAWVVDLDGPDIAEVLLVPTAPPFSNPSTFDLFVDCGDIPIMELYFGLILPDEFVEGDPFNFADCLNNNINADQLHCTNPNTLGPNVDSTSFYTRPFIDPSMPQQRDDALYLHLIGQGGSTGQTICEPGDDLVFLGPISFQGGTPSLVRSAFDGSNGLSPDGGALLADRSLGFRMPPSNSDGVDIRIRPDLIEASGERWSVSLEASDRLGCFSFGITLPPAEANAFFGNCATPENGSFFNERSCATGVDLGPNLDPGTVRTMGPSPNLELAGLRGDTLYVFVGGGLTGPTPMPAINVPNNRMDLGTFSLTGATPQTFGRVPTLELEELDQLSTVWSDFSDWCDSDGTDVMFYSYTSGTAFGPVGDTDVDGDGVATGVDSCPFVQNADQQDGGTLEQADDSVTPSTVIVESELDDAIGSHCQCGDVTQSSSVVSGDIGTLRLALANPELSSLVMEPYKCNSIGPSLPGVINPETNLPADCNLNDVFALLKARMSEGPLIPPVSTFVSCPDIYEPPS